jgi:hypothetical protein
MGRSSGAVLRLAGPRGGHDGNSGDEGKFRHKKAALSARLADDGQACVIAVAPGERLSGVGLQGASSWR